MDGKHIRIWRPAHSGSEYYNYKRFHSIILLALVDCDHRILTFDLEAAGHVGDAGVFRYSRLKVRFENNDHLFPPTRPLGTVGAVQYHILVDCSFAQSYRYIKPYLRDAANTPAKRMFNRKHSGARSVVEQTFGILCRRFAMLQNEIEMTPRNRRKVVTSLLVLHNLTAERENVYERAQRYPAPVRELVPLADIGERADVAFTARERLTQYYARRSVGFANNECELVNITYKSVGSCVTAYRAVLL